MLTRRKDPEVEAPVLGPPHEKRRLPIKDPDVGKDGGHKEKGTTEDKMLDGVLEATNMRLTKLREAVEDRSACRALVHGVTKSRTLLNN